MHKMYKKYIFALLRYDTYNRCRGHQSECIRQHLELFRIVVPTLFTALFHWFDANVFEFLLILIIYGGVQQNSIYS